MKKMKTEKKTLRELRRSTGMSQEALAELLGVKSRQIHNFEKDSSKIPNDLLFKYMKGFDLKYEQIYLGKMDDSDVQKLEENKQRFIRNLAK